ncbi:hypothetical protein FB567DRAFT_603493 [Paraphoma chrysanthemicola]|uniref:Uncharacterized protein n=1 Tax=Paraphoma chrysanthemicola TaxID=798071 RepID=A0A8K0VYJ2_9PLEO|nr:hypothetical protein FB567DRAFT_603493 [Paraphoma chrysanthemicola]
MPRYLRGSEIDLEEAYGPLLDKTAHLSRNIRTGMLMSRTHHCEDPECGGRAPSRKCILRGHVAFCLAPVVDRDHTSKTFNEVTIHGERFAVISPQGCAEHHYTDGYNVDIKDARNGRHNFPIIWKKRLEEFRAQHEADIALEAEKREAMHKRLGMTGHQRQTMYARQDREEYLRRRDAGIADLMRDGMEAMAEATTVPRPTEDMTRQLSKSEVREAGELAVQVRAVTSEETKLVATPLWLYNELFGSPNDGAIGIGELNEYAGLDSCTPRPQEIANPTEEWLHGQLYPESTGIGEEEEEEEIEPGSLIDPSSIALQPQDGYHSEAALGPVSGPPRKRERKGLKKMEAAKARALARTKAEELTKKELDDEELIQSLKAQKGTQKSARNKRLTRAGRTAYI